MQKVVLFGASTLDLPSKFILRLFVADILVTAGISSHPTSTVSTEVSKSGVENRLIVRHRPNARTSGIQPVPKLFNNSDIVLGTFKVSSFSSYTRFLIHLMFTHR